MPADPTPTETPGAKSAEGLSRRVSEAVEMLQRAQKRDQWCDAVTVEPDDLRVLLTSHALLAARSPSTGEAERLREALANLTKRRKSIENDVRSAHFGRGDGASEWMREDDREFRRDLSAAFDQAEAALSEGGKS